MSVFHGIWKTSLSTFLSVAMKKERDEAHLSWHKSCQLFPFPIFWSSLCLCESHHAQPVNNATMICSISQIPWRCLEACTGYWQWEALALKCGHPPVWLKQGVKSFSALRNSCFAFKQNTDMASARLQFPVKKENSSWSPDRGTGLKGRRDASSSCPCIRNDKPSSTTTEDFMHCKRIHFTKFFLTLQFSLETEHRCASDSWPWNFTHFVRVSTSLVVSGSVITHTENWIYLAIHIQKLHFILRWLLFHYMTRHSGPFTFTAERNIWNAFGHRAADHKLPMLLEVDRIPTASVLRFKHSTGGIIQLIFSCELLINSLSGFCLHNQDLDH